MEQIDKSPYEGRESAEVGEHLFEYMESVMDPDRNSDSTDAKRGPHDEAIEVFGSDQARTILETNRHVSSSGILYACGWSDGIIMGRHCGYLEKELLLLCLCDHRIARSDAAGTKIIVKDLNIWKIVSSALRRWKLKKKYPRLTRCDGISSFKTKQNDCFKCIIFLARVATCIKYLEWNILRIPDDTSLKQKIFACFDILESNATVNPKKKARKKRALDSPIETSQHHNCNKTSLPAQDLDHNRNKNSQSELSQRLRRKSCKIARIEFHPEPKTKKGALDVTRTTKNMPNPASVYTNKESIQPESKTTLFSHALLASAKLNSSQTTKEPKLVDVPKSFELAAKHNLPSYVSDGSSMHSGSNDPNFWFPVDKEELILNSLQIETAWLVEESMYCQRSTKIDWLFMLKYASPTLQIELRRISDIVGSNDEDALASLLHNAIEAKRFVVLRREIKRKLLKSVVRTRMQGILPRLRMATHPLRRKKLKSKPMNATKQYDTAIAK